MPLRLGAIIESEMARVLPLLVIDPGEGRLIQCLEFPTRASNGTVIHGGKRFVVATSGSARGIGGPK
jgi:hypothetical protein